MKSNEKVVGHYYQHDKKPYTIIVSPENAEQLMDKGANWGELHEATMRWFVDHEGFSSESLCLKPVNSHSDSLAGELEFVDDGIVMAKLQGYLE